MRSVEARVHNGNGSVVLVDTTGLDDDWRNAKDTLGDIYGWLRQKSVSFNKSEAQVTETKKIVTKIRKWRAFYFFKIYWTIIGLSHRLYLSCIRLEETTL